MQDSKSKNNPKISVIIPVLNAERSLEKAIRSVLDQDYNNIELIILDAGSTDGTLEIIKRFEHQIYYWHSKPDGSAYHAINLGIEKSTGDLVAQLMADDWFEPAIFKAIVQAYLNNPNAEILSCGGRIVSFDDTTNSYKLLTEYTDAKKIGLNFYNICFGVPAMSTRFLTRALIGKIGLIKPFDSQGKHTFSGDREYLLRVSVNHRKSIIVPLLGHTYLAHQGSATFGKNRQITLRIFQEHMEIAQIYLAKNDLTQQQRNILKYWYNDQSIRYLLFNLLSWDFGAVLQSAISGLKLTKLSWLVALLYIPCKITWNKYIANVIGKSFSKNLVS